MSLSFASVFLCIALSALPLEGKTRRGDDKDWPEFIQKYAVSQHPDEVELWRWYVCSCQLVSVIELSSELET